MASAETAQVTGIITDANSAVIAGAQVTFTTVATVVVRMAVTNADGHYRIPLCRQAQSRAVSDLLTSRSSPRCLRKNFWLNKLNQFNGNFINAEMVKAFIVSNRIPTTLWPVTPVALSLR